MRLHQLMMETGSAGHPGHRFAEFLELSLVQIPPSSWRRGSIGDDGMQDDDNSSSWDQQPSYQDPGPSGPLAGENVMNVILVGAECAPWSKTGKLQIISPLWVRDQCGKHSVQIAAASLLDAAAQFAATASVMFQVAQ